MSVAAPETALSSSARPDVARSLKDAAITALIAFALLLPLIGFKTVQNMRNELELETRIPLLLIIVAIITAANLFGALVIHPWRERRALRTTPEDSRVTTVKTALAKFCPEGRKATPRARIRMIAALRAVRTNPVYGGATCWS